MDGIVSILFSTLLGFPTQVFGCPDLPLTTSRPLMSPLFIMSARRPQNEAGRVTADHAVATLPCLRKVQTLS